MVVPRIFDGDALLWWSGTKSDSKAGDRRVDAKKLSGDREFSTPIFFQLFSEHRSDSNAGTTDR